jgi:hypothetical protein
MGSTSGQAEREEFMRVVETIRARFPSLRTELVAQHPHVQASLEMPAQQGLAFSVSINLQNCDELHFNVGSFWCEWFPCLEREICDRFVEAVCGFVSGAYRIVEHRRGGVALKAELQRPEGGGWQRVATWSRPHLPVSWGMSTRILQNVPGG